MDGECTKCAEVAALYARIEKKDAEILKLRECLNSTNDLIDWYYNEEPKQMSITSDITNEEFVEYFDAISTRVHDIAKQKGWWDAERNDGELIALIHSELSEAIESIRKGNQPDNHLPQHNGAVVELADAVIRIMDMAEARQWPIAQAIIDKIEYNKTREKMHGGKKF